MTGQKMGNVERIRAFAGDGLTHHEAAERLDICVPYVKSLAKAHNIVLAQHPKLSEIRIGQIKQLAAQGLTRRQAAEQLDLQYITIVKHALEHDIRFIHANFKALPSVRTRQMAALYQSGKTLQEIGDQYGITRERVRQLITKFHGLRASHGGMHKRTLEKRAKHIAKKNAYSLKRWGCTWDQYRELRDMKKPTRAFTMQRRNAKTREIAWEMTLWQWWVIWQQSGKWAERGRGQGYVMCRPSDEGPYAVDNVFIATARANSSNQIRKKNGLPIGVRKNKKCAGFTAFRSINGKKLRLGSHPTPELAYAAYLAAEASQ